MKLTDIVVALPGSHLSSDLGGEFVILSLIDEVYYGLEAVAARVWELVQSPRDVGSIIDTVRGEFDVDRERCATEIDAFLEDLKARSFIVVNPA